MLLELLSAAFIGGGLLKDQIEQNQKYYGTSRDMHSIRLSILKSMGIVGRKCCGSV